MSQITTLYPATTAELAAGVTLVNQAYPPGNVFRYGATGDGSTNDRDAIQAAIDGAGPYGRVTLPKPAAHYFTGATSLKILDGQWIQGESRADSGGSSNNLGTTIRYTGTGSAIQGIGKDSNTTTANIRLSGLRLIGHSAAQVLDASGWINSLVEFINIDSANSSGVGVLLASTSGTGIGGGPCYYNTFFQLTILNSTGIGIKILQAGDTGTNDNRIVGGKNVALVGIKFEGTGTGSINSGNVVREISFESGQNNTRAVWVEAGVDNSFCDNRYEHPGTGSLDFLFGTKTGRNMMFGGHFGSSVAGARITDNSDGTNGINGWFAPVSGSLVQLQAKLAQVRFPPSAVTSTDANTLDAYAEGTWTPGLTFGGLSSGMTFSSRSGRYIRIGDAVWCWFWLQIGTKGSSMGTARLTGLPFTVVNAVEMCGAGDLNYWVNFTGMTAAPRIYATPNSTLCQFAESGANGIADIDHTKFQDTTIVSGTVFFRLN